jgi:hypothetical protein
MITASVLSVFIFIFILVGISGSSKADNTVKNTAWAFAKYSTKNVDFNAHVGLNRVVFRNIDEDSTDGYNFHDCTFSYCSDCEKAGDSALSSLAIAFIFSIPSVISSTLRRNKETDLVMHKVIPVLFGAVELLMIVIAMGSFADNCFKKLPADDHYDLSTGFNVILVALVFQVVVMLLHILTPVVKSTQGLLDN